MHSRTHALARTPFADYATQVIETLIVHLGTVLKSRLLITGSINLPCIKMVTPGTFLQCHVLGQGLVYKVMVAVLLICVCAHVPACVCHVCAYTYAFVCVVEGYEKYTMKHSVCEVCVF